MTRIQKRKVFRKSKKMINDKVVKMEELPIIKLGDGFIYPEQQQCAINIKKILDKNKDIAVLFAQAQQGKTGACAMLVELFIQEWNRLNIENQTVFLGAYSNNALREQTRDRLTEFGLLSNEYLPEEQTVFEYHHPDLSYKMRENIKRIKQGIWTLIIVDEGHIAQGGSGLFNKFMKLIGVKYGQPKSTWTYQNIHIVVVSATPFAYRVKELMAKGGVSFSKLEVSSNYYSLEQMMKDGRLFQAEKILTKVGKKSVVSEWHKERLKQFQSICDKTGNGYMIVRVHNTNDISNITKFIRNTYKNIGIKLFDCSKTVGSQPIENLSPTLSKCPEKPTIVFIKRALGVGQTVSTTKYFRMWIDNPSTKADVTIQSIGRTFGYITEYDKKYALENSVEAHSKFKDTFPVFCDMKEIDISIEHYKNPEESAVPSGINNGVTKRIQKVGNGYMLIFDSKNGGDAKSEFRKLVEPVKKTMLELHNKERAEKNRPLYKGVDLHITCSKVSDTNNPNDWAYHIRNFHNRGNTDKISDGLKGVRIIHIDKINVNNSNKKVLEKHTESWATLKRDFPNAIGSIVYILSEQEFEILMMAKKQKGYKHISNYEVLNPPEALVKEDFALKNNCTMDIAVQEITMNAAKNQQNLKQKSKKLV